VDRGIALSIRDLGAKMGWVVSTTPRPFYPRERPGTHCTGGWVGPRAGLDVCKKLFIITFIYLLLFIPEYVIEANIVIPRTKQLWRNEFN
jgi:hypothetical protein